MSKNTTVGGKKPLSSKPKKVSPFQEPDFFTNKTSLPAETIAEIEAKGWEYRWIDYKKYVSDGNSHSRGWRAFRSDKRGTTDEFQLGANPDGIIRRNSLLLAVRPVEHGEKHRAWIASKNNALKGHKQSLADELRQKAKDASVDSVIDDSYDEADEEN